MNFGITSLLAEESKTRTLDEAEITGTSYARAYPTLSGLRIIDFPQRGRRSPAPGQRHQDRKAPTTIVRSISKMRAWKACLVSLTFVTQMATAISIYPKRVSEPTANQNYLLGTETAHTTSVVSNVNDDILTPQENRNGWVNPEDLSPMPQCITQQDQSAWLAALTSCTYKQCTRHFGPLICTRHEWLTQLSCLAMTFSPDVVRGYLPYCSRSVLAKAQLYSWVHEITGRTWLVDVGDANELQHLAPSVLREGYAVAGVSSKAPVCLTRAASAHSMELFQHVMASCSFTGTTQHTGNAARPWEYRESVGSMIALDSETVGYDLVGGNLRSGDYFDRACLCSTFGIDFNNDPCSRPEHIEMTQEWLWLNATCGPKSLPEKWTDQLRTTEYAYIAVENWRWPKCIEGLPSRILALPHRCTTDACEIDSSGYYKTKRAVDRACFCRNISYKSCGGTCHDFENRITYVHWLHDMCGGEDDWHGLPHKWHRLARPSRTDMIPWRWNVKPQKHLGTHPSESEKVEAKCPSNDMKLGSFVIANIATLLAIYFFQRTVANRSALGFLSRSDSSSWVLSGLAIAALHILANWFIALVVQNTLGYENVPAFELMLLLLTTPRLAWLPVLLVGGQPVKAIDLSTAAPSIFAETILQLVASYYMFMTFNYGREHKFYLGALEGANGGDSAKIMYAGAILWLLVIVAALVQGMRAIRSINTAASSDIPEWQAREPIPTTISAEMAAQLNEQCALLGENMRRQTTHFTTYGTVPNKLQDEHISGRAMVEPYVITVSIMFLLWVAQWLFWSGFIGVSSDE
jgi:hypothetical protein